MKKLRASDILDANNLSGWRLEQIFALLRRYGFIESENSGSKHYRFLHPDYPDLTIGFQHGPHTEVPRAYVKDAAELCMQVKRRNQAARTEKYDTIPSWILDGLPPGEAIENDDRSMTIHAHARDVSGRDTESHSPIMNYRLTYKKTGDQRRVTFTSLNMPNSQAQLTYRHGSRERSAAVRRMLQDFDSEQRGHVRLSHNEQANKLAIMRDNCGFTITTVERDGVPGLHIHHPVYPITLNMPLPADNCLVPAEALEAMNDAISRVEERYITDYERLNALCDREGWSHHHDREHQPVHYMVSHPGGCTIRVPTYGALGVFSVDEIERQMNQQRNIPVGMQAVKPSCKVQGLGNRMTDEAPPKSSFAQRDGCVPNRPTLAARSPGNRSK